MILIRIKETKGRHLVIAAIYRQWKAPGETGANTADGISRQCARLRAMTDKLSNICEEKYKLLIAVDLDIDRKMPDIDVNCNRKMRQAPRGGVCGRKMG